MQPRANRIETLGAWLHLWTPPRDVYVAPPPAPRRVAAIGLAVAVALALVLVLAVALIGKGKERGAARVRRENAAFTAKERARLRVDQAPHHARGNALPPPAPAARYRAARSALIGDLEGAITADAQARYRRHKLDARATGTHCIPFVRPSVANPPQPPLGAREGKYECIARTASLRTASRLTSPVVGYPFWARVDFRNSRLTWCKVNRRPGEAGIGGDLFVPLKPECDLLNH